ncbi:MAG: hypothetical protein AAF563_21740 [Pseudomonadota bacterium]
MTSTLIVCYSRTGTTRRVTDAIVAASGAPAEIITEARSRGGFFNYMRSGKEALLKRAAPIQPTHHDPSGFGLIVLGCPVWAGHIPSPMLTYIDTNKRRMREVAFFATQMSSSADKMFRQMAAQIGREPVATLTLLQRDVDSGSHLDAVQRFAAELDTVSRAA